MKVNPLEVESVLCEHPAIRQCVVLGVRASDTVQRVKAVVVPREGAQPDANVLRRFARDRLAPYKVPRVIELRDALPTSATGKIQRRLVQS
ncbi:MAG: hypothetical protein CMJ18_26710 [Phycisphaeraceae bacterium]|nr:hypothetical protein [Phycisphaeraceae bacterium]